MSRPVLLQRNQSMFLLRTQFPLAVQRFERQRQVPARFGGFDDFVHQPPPRGDIGIGKCLAILFDQFLAARGLVVRGLDFTAKDDFGRALGAHHRDLRRRPRNHAIRTQSLGAHGDVRAAVGLAQHHGDFGNRRRRVGKQQLGAVADDAAALLLHAGQKSRHIDKGQQRNIECIAEAHKARRLVGGVDVEHAGQALGWLATMPTGLPCRRPKPMTMFGANPG